MIGPGEGVGGGIASLVEIIVPALNQKVELEYFPTVKRRPLRESGKISPHNAVIVLFQYARFLSALNRFHPHIIHLHTSHGIAWLKDTFFVLVGKGYGCRVVLHMHGGNFFEIYNKSNYSIKRYTYRMACLADAVLEVSTERMKHLARLIPIKRPIALRNCIDLNAISPGFSNQFSNGKKALFLGLLGPSKGVFDLLEAMARLKSSGCSLQLWVAGHEEQKGCLIRARRRLQELGLQDRCHLVGNVFGERKSQLLREASLFVLPSYQEALPMAILEAMAAGLPIVATQVGGIPEVVKDGYNGFLIAPGNVEALADRLAVLANDQHMRAVMGWRSRQIAERELGVKPYVRRLVELYESLVKP